MSVRYAVIGGSGVYEIEGMKVLQTFFPSTPFGKPSDKIVIGEYHGIRIAFLPRHGKVHRFLPSEIPQKANFYALKLLGVEFVIALSACGSLKEELSPRDFVLPDQIVDRTKGRDSTFFGNGIVAHISFAHPFAKNLVDVIAHEARNLKLNVHAGGTYVCMEGPAFSTKAESKMHRQMGFDVIGMTAIPEAKLATESEMSYALVAMVTDYDCWKDHDEVSVEMLIGNLMANAENAKKLISHVVPKLEKLQNNNANVLAGAIFTQPKAMNPATKKKLMPLIKKYVK